MSSLRLRGVRPSQFLVVAASITLMALTGLMVVDRVTSSSDGTIVQLSNAPWQSDDLKIAFVLQVHSPLRVRDQVLAVDRQNVSRWLSSPEPDITPEESGGLHEYQVLREGQRVVVPVRLGRFPLGRFLTFNWSSLLLLSLLLIVSVFVFLRRPADPAAQALLMVASCATFGLTAWLFGVQVVDLATRGVSGLEVAGEVALAMTWGAILHFTLLAPGTRPLLPSRWAMVVTAYLLPFLLHGALLHLLRASPE